jgi:hypothetical protein
MLWSQFSAIFGDFWQFLAKKLAFSQKPMLCSNLIGQTQFWPVGCSSLIRLLVNWMDMKRMSPRWPLCHLGKKTWHLFTDRNFFSATELQTTIRSLKHWLSKSDGIVWSLPGKCPTMHVIRILIFLYGVPEQPLPASGRWSDSWHKIKSHIWLSHAIFVVEVETTRWRQKKMLWSQFWSQISTNAAGFVKKTSPAWPAN